MFEQSLTQSILSLFYRKKKITSPNSFPSVSTPSPPGEVHSENSFSGYIHNLWPKIQKFIFKHFPILSSQYPEVYTGDILVYFLSVMCLYVYLSFFILTKVCSVYIDLYQGSFLVNFASRSCV